MDDAAPPGRRPEISRPWYRRGRLPSRRHRSIVSATDPEAPMAYEHILYDVKDRIATITLNRPDKLNAYTGTMGIELEDAFIAANEDDNVRVIIVTGAGRGFCAGADISS